MLFLLKPVGMVCVSFLLHDRTSRSRDPPKAPNRQCGFVFVDHSPKRKNDTLPCMKLIVCCGHNDIYLPVVDWSAPLSWPISALALHHPMPKIFKSNTYILG